MGISRPPSLKTFGDGKPRCGWLSADALYVAYHDTEWGVPVHDDDRLFEKITLEGAQAGLSWLTILKKRARYREVYHGFDPARVARFTARDVARLLEDPGIVRNRAKIESSIGNARAFLDMQEREGPFADWLWSMVDGEPIVNRFRTLAEVPAKTPLSDRVSKELKRRGFRFVGSTTMYAMLQSVGVVNDHLVGCWRAP